MSNANNRDPWGKPSNSGEGGRNSPPDLDEIINSFGKFFKSGRKSPRRVNGGDDNQGNGNKGKSGLLKGNLLALLAVVVLWSGMGFYVINEQERAIVLRFGEYKTTLAPGLRWQPYLIDKVRVINVTRVRTAETQGLMLTKDENIVDIALSIQYIVNSPKDFYFNVRQPESALKLASDSAIRHVVGSTPMDKVITEGRAEVALGVKDRVQLYLNDYGAGILISQINIQRADPPQDVKPAFEDVISAREDEVRFVNQATAYANSVIPEARGQAQRILEDANGYKAQVIAVADGEASRFEKLLGEYKRAPAVTKRRLYIEAMEQVLSNSSKILLDVSDGNNILYLPLDKIVNQQQLSNNQAFTNTGRSSSNETSDVNIRNLTDKVLEELNNRNLLGGRR